MKLMANLAVCAVLLTSVLSAEDLSSWTYDFASPTPAPVWVGVVSQTIDSNFFGRQDFQITPVDDSRDLLLTLFFQEVDGGFLRVYWVPGTSGNSGGTSAPVLLSQNLYEGVAKGLTNRRTILLSASLLKGGGVLSFQAGQPDLKISRIRWDWLKPQAVPVSMDSGIRIGAVGATGEVLAVQELTGDPILPDSDQWKGSIILAPITEKVESIGDGVEFGVELEAVPALARVEAQLLGVPLDQRMVLWVNGKVAGLLSLPVPDLTDPGYQTSQDGKTSYIGWQKAAILVPNGLLQAGNNRLQFSWQDEGLSNIPLTLKNLKLQLKYPTVAAPPPLVSETAPTGGQTPSMGGEQPAPIP
ncbi:MAG: hypothetical protein PHD76_06470 [Methylacidiphilales bacterium]|nr:hypothetical protein [Candidatus Methylacidiphilales bacterium]